MSYDELYEILSWMPAKSAIKYSSPLCKCLCNIHSEPRFMQKQCIHSSGQDNGFFLQHTLTKYGKVPTKFEFHVLPWETGSAFGIPHKSLDHLPKYGHILSSSNGLLLLGDLSKSRCSFKVCNPATREWAHLPTPKGFKCLVNENFSPLIECFPWGHDPPNNVVFPNDYTIALPVLTKPPWLRVQNAWKKNHKQQLLIYSNGKWEEELCSVGIEGRVVRYATPVAFFSDATKGLLVHYLCDSDTPGRDGLPDDGPGKKVYMEPYIAVFDIREKKLLREIKLPEEACGWGIGNWWGGSYGKLWIYKWKETSICLVRWFSGCAGMAMWVLDDYGCKGETWRLVMHKREWELWDDDEVEWISGVGAVNGKGLLIATDIAHAVGNLGSRVYLYGVEGERQGKLELLGEHHLGTVRVSFVPYANTLRPVSVQNAETCTY